MICDFLSFLQGAVKSPDIHTKTISVCSELVYLQSSTDFLP